MCSIWCIFMESCHGNKKCSLCLLTHLKNCPITKITIAQLTYRTAPTPESAAAPTITTTPRWATRPPSAQAPSLPAQITVRNMNGLHRFYTSKHSSNKGIVCWITCHIFVCMNWLEVCFGHEWTEVFSCPLTGYLMASGGMHTLPTWINTVHSCVFIKQNRWQ